MIVGHLKGKKNRNKASKQYTNVICPRPHHALCFRWVGLEGAKVESPQLEINGTTLTYFLAAVDVLPHLTSRWKLVNCPNFDDVYFAL